MQDLAKFLEPGTYLNSNHHLVQSYAAAVVQETDSPLNKSLALYYHIRDSVSYFPYFIDLGADSMKASNLVAKRKGHCIAKAALLAATVRSVGIPSRLGFAKVRNHIGTAGLEKYLETNVLAPHGYAALYLNNQWVKATPAFDKKLCEKLGVAPLEFDGQTDSIFQPYSSTGSKQMEYLEDFGTYADTPRSLLIDLLKSHYPQIFKKSQKQRFLMNIPEQYLT